MWPHIIITAVALFALGCEAVAAAKGTSGPHQGKSIGGSRQDGRRSASGDYSRSSQARRLNQQPPTRNGYAKEVRGKDDELVLDNGRKARKPRAGLDEATEDYDHVEARGNFRVLDGYFVGPADNRVEEVNYRAKYEPLQLRRCCFCLSYLLWLIPQTFAAIIISAQLAQTSESSPSLLFYVARTIF